jgi:predicted acyl esterase
LDAAASTPERPVHLHTHEERLAPREPVAVDIEIWPFSVRFAPGESLRLVIAGKDIYEPEEGVALHFRGTELAEAVSARRDAFAYRVALADGRVEETRIVPRYLG